MVGDEIMAANTSHTKEDPLETEINLRIAEQQDEVKKLREENLRVMELAEECQRQIEKINTEAEHQEQETHKYISQVVAQSKERQTQITQKLKAQQESSNKHIEALKTENEQLMR
jgi:precorrin-2 methylase